MNTVKEMHEKIASSTLTPYLLRRDLFLTKPSLVFGIGISKHLLTRN